MIQESSKHAAAGQAAKSAKAAHSAHGLHWLMGFGTMGLFVVSAIDSSIIPLPVPGSTDLLLILLVVGMFILLLVKPKRHRAEKVEDIPPI